MSSVNTTATAIVTTPTPTPTKDIAIQNEEYLESLYQNIQKTNEKIIEMMDDTIRIRDEQQSAQRLEAMNSLDPHQRRRLMSGEKIEDIIDNFDTNESRYYNTSEEAARAIPKDELFEYQIGNHLMAYEINDVTIDQQSKILYVPVVVYNAQNSDYEELNFGIHDEDIYNIILQQKKLDVSPDLPSSPEDVFAFTDIVTVSPAKQIRRIQDQLSEQILSLYDGNTMYSSQVYSDEMVQCIDQMLQFGKFPFQIVNELLTSLANLH